MIQEQNGMINDTRNARQVKIDEDKISVQIDEDDISVQIVEDKTSVQIDGGKISVQIDGQGKSANTSMNMARTVTLPRTRQCMTTSDIE